MRIPYLVEQKGRYFYQPTKLMRVLGFQPKPLGADRASAEREAMRLYHEWGRVRRGEATAPGAAPVTRETACAARRYPRGSVGEAWQRWIRTSEWAQLAPKNRNGQWWPAWTLRIEPMFGTVDPRTITYDMMSDWRTDIVERDGLDSAHRAFKIWRRYWKIMAAMRYCARAEDPSLGIRNRGLKGRSQRFREGEVVRLVKGAWRAGFRGLACVIAVEWDTQFGSGDTRKLRRRHVAQEPASKRMMFDVTEDGRAKNGTPILGTISARTERLVRTYLDGLGVELTDEAFLFRNRSGRPYREDTLPDDFAVVREAVLGDGERRQLRDLRRSGAIEAGAGDVSGKALADKMGNSINTSDKLQKVYQPVELANVLQADAARLLGRRRIRAGSGTKSGQKV